MPCLACAVGPCEPKEQNRRQEREFGSIENGADCPSKVSHRITARTRIMASQRESCCEP